MAETTIFPESLNQTLLSRHKILKTIREYLHGAGYIEVDTPMRVHCPGFDPYINAISAGKGFYLITSPELHMKRLLHLGIPKIYQITHAFRDHEQGPSHNSEFTILEWYRTNANYLDIIDEAEQIIKTVMLNGSLEYPHCSHYEFPFLRISVDELFQEKAGWVPSQNWDEDRFFSDWVNKIDPFLYSLKGVFIFDFPSPLAALAKIKINNPLLCERFEMFMGGIEVANAFTELIDPIEQEFRFKEALIKRKSMNKEIYPVDDKFLETMRQGIPPCAGIAIGIDRLVMALLGYRDIRMVQSFPLDRL